MGDFFSAIGDVVSNEVSYSGAVRLSVVLIFAAVGETIAERAGTLNISLEGMVLGGAFAAAMGMDLTSSVAVGLLFSIGAGVAITRLSDPLEEWDEVELKARRIVETVAEIERTFGVKNTRRRER